MKYRPVPLPPGTRVCTESCIASQPGFGPCDCFLPELNPVYAEIRAAFPEANSCPTCIELWFRSQNLIPTPGIRYSWARADEHSTLEDRP